MVGTSEAPRWSTVLSGRMRRRHLPREEGRVWQWGQEAWKGPRRTTSSDEESQESSGVSPLFMQWEPTRVRAHGVRPSLCP